MEQAQAQLPSRPRGSGGRPGLSRRPGEPWLTATGTPTVSVGAPLPAPASPGMLPTVLVTLRPRHTQPKHREMAEPGGREGRSSRDPDPPVGHASAESPAAAARALPVPPRTRLRAAGLASRRPRDAAPGPPAGYRKWEGSVPRPAAMATEGARAGGGVSLSQPIISGGVVPHPKIK